MRTLPALLVLSAALLPGCNSSFDRAGATAAASDHPGIGEDPALASVNAELPKVGSPLPQLAAATLDGKPFSFAALRGKTVLLNVWFVHCPACREELPLVETLQQEIKGRSDVLIVAHDAGVDSRDAVAQYWKESGFTFPALVDAGAPGDDSRRLGIAACPTNIVIGPDGKVLYASVSFDERVIRKLLAAPAKG